MVSFSLLGLQHPEPNGSRRATPTSTNIDRDIPGLASIALSVQYEKKHREGGTMEGRRFTLSLVMFLAVFGFGLYLLMSGIAVRPWGFGAVYDPQRTFGGAFLMLGALTVALYLAARSTIPRNPAKAARWFRKAAEKGGAAAQFNLGILYDTGRGVPRDLGAAVTWYRKAAEQGFAEAQFNLAQMYRRGEGAESDAAEAVKWLLKAAKQGHVVAQFNLSHMYEHGVGVDKDDTEAANWCREAAEQGHGDAQYNLGQMYRLGQGVPRDPGEASKWLRRAAT